MTPIIRSLLFAAVLMTAPAMALAQPVGGVTRNPAEAEAGAYNVESVHTRVLFSVSHMGFTTWYGEFTHVSGTLNLDPAKPAGSTLEIHIPVDTVSTSNTKLDSELKSGQWFDAAQFPEIVFKLTRVARTGKTAARVTGDLTFHGVTRPVTLTVKFNSAGINPLDKKYTAGFEVSGKIRRSDFGVKAYLPLIGNDVDLMVSAGFEHE